jgi:hypothetical protein
MQQITGDSHSCHFAVQYCETSLRHHAFTTTHAFEVASETVLQCQVVCTGHVNGGEMGAPEKQENDRFHFDEPVWH